MPVPTLVNEEPTLKEWFEHKRARRKMTKEEVAEEMGVSVNSLGRALNTPSTADSAVIRGLVEFLEIDHEEWFEVLCQKYGMGGRCYLDELSLLLPPGKAFGVVQQAA